MGGTAGRQIGDRPEFETFVAVGATELACVLCHELGHARGLVRAGSARKYDVSQQEFNSGVPRRPPAADNLANDLWYDSTFGGSGTHCSSGASPVDSCITRSKRTYSHAGAGPLCLMYHASVTGHIEAVRFCRVCILQLRRR